MYKKFLKLMNFIEIIQNFFDITPIFMYLFLYQSFLFYFVSKFS